MVIYHWAKCINVQVLLLVFLAGCSLHGLVREREFLDYKVVGFVPDTNEAIIQIYSARSYEWPSRVASVHTWLAYRQKNEKLFTRLEVHNFGSTAVKRCQRQRADRRWHGADPELLFELLGNVATAAISKIEKAAIEYEVLYGGYGLYPGPNSNSFIAHIVREVPELTAELLPTAIGKDFLPPKTWATWSPSGTGVQVSFNGMLGIMVGLQEGVEVNVFGAVFGFDVLPPALKLPIFGRVGVPQGRWAPGVVSKELKNIQWEYRCR